MDIASLISSLLDLDQVHIILNIIGSPSAEDLESVTSEQVWFAQHYKYKCSIGSVPLQARRYLQSLPYRPTVPWSRLYTQADKQGIYIAHVQEWSKYNQNTLHSSRSVGQDVDIQSSQAY